MTAILLLLLAQSPTGLPLADLPGYKAALEAPPSPAAPRVRFRDLWDHPDDFRSRQVRVDGRPERSFRAPASGELPPRSEWWLATESDDLICIVFPDSGQASPPKDVRVQMSGTSLGLVRYRSGDVTRIAPLIVGPKPPTAIPESKSSRPDDRTLDWVAASCLAAVVAIVLARIHLRARPKPPVEPASDIQFES
jgi:hypothetical protein